MPFVGPTPNEANKTGLTCNLNNCFQRKMVNSWRSGKYSHGKEKATPVSFRYFLITELTLGTWHTYSAFFSLLAAKSRWCIWAYAKVSLRRAQYFVTAWSFRFINKGWIYIFSIQTPILFELDITIIDKNRCVFSYGWEISQTASSQNMKDYTSSDTDVPGNKSWSRRVLILILVIIDQEIQLSFQDRHRRY